MHPSPLVEQSIKLPATKVRPPLTGGVSGISRRDKRQRLEAKVPLHHHICSTSSQTISPSTYDTRSTAFTLSPFHTPNHHVFPIQLKLGNFTPSSLSQTHFRGAHRYSPSNPSNHAEYLRPVLQNFRGSRRLDHRRSSCRPIKPRHGRLPLSPSTVHFRGPGCKTSKGG